MGGQHAGGQYRRVRITCNFSTHNNVARDIQYKFKKIGKGQSIILLKYLPPVGLDICIVISCGRSFAVGRAWLCAVGRARSCGRVWSFVVVHGRSWSFVVMRSRSL